MRPVGASSVLSPEVWAAMIQVKRTSSAYPPPPRPPCQGHCPKCREAEWEVQGWVVATHLSHVLQRSSVSNKASVLVSFAWVSLVWHMEGTGL